MKVFGGVVVVLVVLALIFGGMLISSYNSLVSGDESVDGEWANVGTALQRRMDLIPNLVSTVKGYAAHEKETLQAVVEARQQVTKIDAKAALNDPAMMAKFQQAQQGLSGALSRLMVVVERYPDLKANQNFLNLQHELAGTENRIKIHRQRYNDAVKG